MLWLVQFAGLAWFWMGRKTVEAARGGERHMESR